MVDVNPLVGTETIKLLLDSNLSENNLTSPSALLQSCTNCTVAGRFDSANNQFSDVTFRRSHQVFFEVTVTNTVHCEWSILDDI